MAYSTGGDSSILFTDVPSLSHQANIGDVFPDICHTEINWTEICPDSVKLIEENDKMLSKASHLIFFPQTVE